MKNLTLWVFACVFACLQASSQQVPLEQHPVEKPLLFNQLPEKIYCSENGLQQLFTAALNSNLTASLSSQFKIEGTVIARANVSSNQLSVNIRCNNFKNALLNISRLAQPDGSFNYVGRLLSPQHGDILLLWQENGQYVFVHQKQLLTMVE